MCAYRASPHVGLAVVVVFGSINQPFRWLWASAHYITNRPTILRTNLKTGQMRSKPCPKRNSIWNKKKSRDHRKFCQLFRHPPHVIRCQSGFVVRQWASTIRLPETTWGWLGWGPIPNLLSVWRSRNPLGAGDWFLSSCADCLPSTTLNHRRG